MMMMKSVAQAKASPPERRPRLKQGLDPIPQFVALSATLTGFDAAELWGTGMVRPHYTALGSIVGARVVGALLSEWARLETLANGDEERLARLLSDELFAHVMLGPVTRNLTMLWYLGLWTQLPLEWRDVHGANALDVTHYVSAQAYREGLVWSAIHAHPQGAKQPGYGSWSLVPLGGDKHV